MKDGNFEVSPKFWETKVHATIYSQTGTMTIHDHMSDFDWDEVYLCFEARRKSETKERLTDKPPVCQKCPIWPCGYLKDGTICNHPLKGLPELECLHGAWPLVNGSQYPDKHCRDCGMKLKGED